MLETLKTQKILILGLGREGLSSYRYLRQNLPDQELWLYDDASIQELDEAWKGLLEDDRAAHVVSGLQPLQGQEISLIIKSPGLPPNHPVLTWAKAEALKVTSNTQLLFDFLTTFKPEVLTIGVTGTKGKSTTTSLIYHVLKSGGLSAFLGGNIGVPPLDLVSQLEAADATELAYVVLELSSHQLDDLSTSPQIAVVQNIVPEHLDYYGSFERYLEAKAHITRFQNSSDAVIFNADYPLPKQLAELSPGEKLAFTTDSLPKNIPVTPPELPLLGKHNLENVFPAMIIGERVGLQPEVIASALKTFKPLPHRLELAGEVNGVKYYNDSLSTVPESAIAALSAFKDQTIILLAGGFDRGLEFEDLTRAILAHPVKSLMLFKPTGERMAQLIHQQAGGHQEPTIFFPKSMSEAVQESAKMARPGDIVLMSPASPSFGQFKDYADRGEQFKKAVVELQS